MLAWWLLALLVRVLAPEAAVLRLHLHSHTEHEHTREVVGKANGKALVSPKHQHCHTEQFYDTPFQPALPVQLEVPLRLQPYAEYRVQAPVCRLSHLLDGASLRGPPGRCA
ncbi:hypothetical protein GCM10023185_24930 [Hymenobacter saemangeumensis]|uniref:Secreted protein n=1 Tax=Hymenobacter saemangeumensis TaxID=1084522 RepID=A0ABP8IHM0_9BACT